MLKITQLWCGAALQRLAGEGINKRLVEKQILLRTRRRPIGKGTVSPLLGRELADLRQLAQVRAEGWIIGNRRQICRARPRGRCGLERAEQVPVGVQGQVIEVQLKFIQGSRRAGNGGWQLIRVAMGIVQRLRRWRVRSQQQAAGITGAQMIQLCRLHALSTQERFLLIEPRAIAQLTQHAQQTQAQVSALRVLGNGLTQNQQGLAEAAIGDVDIRPLQRIRSAYRRTRGRQGRLCRRTAGQASGSRNRCDRCDDQRFAARHARRRAGKGARSRHWMTATPPPEPPQQPTKQYAQATCRPIPAQRLSLCGRRQGTDRRLDKQRRSAGRG